MIAARPITPDSGRPPAIDFATVNRSASTSKCSIANIRAGPPEAGLHLVGDEDDPVLVADPAQPLDEGGRSRNEATFALLGLEDDGGDVLSGATWVENMRSSVARAVSASGPRYALGNGAR